MSKLKDRHIRIYYMVLTEPLTDEQKLTERDEKIRELEAEREKQELFTSAACETIERLKAHVARLREAVENQECQEIPNPDGSGMFNRHDPNCIKCKALAETPSESANHYIKVGMERAADCGVSIWAQKVIRAAVKELEKQTSTTTGTKTGETGSIIPDRVQILEAQVARLREAVASDKSAVGLDRVWKLIALEKALTAMLVNKGDGE